MMARGKKRYTRRVMDAVLDIIEQVDTETIRAEKDGAWKHILTEFLPEFADFFWPEIFNAVDWSKPYKSLEQELLSVGNELNHRYVDKLFQVFLKNGQEQWILLHVEVQGKREKHFAERMFVYYYRIHAKYNQSVESILKAFLTRSGKSTFSSHF